MTVPISQLCWFCFLFENQQQLYQQFLKNVKFSPFFYQQTVISKNMPFFILVIKIQIMDKLRIQSRGPLIYNYGNLNTKRKYSTQLPHNIQSSGQKHQCPEPTKIQTKPFTHKNYSNRNSGKIWIDPFLFRMKQRSPLESISSQIKTQLQSLSYREKLLQVQLFFKTARDLCRIYGFFYATFAMLTFQTNEAQKISLWIHPDTFSMKPLHPIKKQTQFECQIQCVVELKNLIRSIFPTVDLSNGKTFSNVIAHLELSKANLQSKKRNAYRDTNRTISTANQTKIKISATEPDSPVLKKNMATNTNITKTLSQWNMSGKLNFSGKNLSNRSEATIQRQMIKSNRGNQLNKQYEDNSEYQKNRKIFKIDQANKQTKSTLMQSIRSANSMRERLRYEMSNSPKTIEDKSFKFDSKKQRKSSWVSHQKFEIAQRRPFIIMPISAEEKSQLKSDEQSEEQTQIQEKKLQENIKEEKKYDEIEKQQIVRKEGKDCRQIKESHLKMKASVSGKKIMSISIQMESQINNLFGSDDLGSNGFYFHNVDRRVIKNSMLSKVAQQFEELF